MPSPIKPNALLETVASVDGDFCEKFVGSLSAPAAFAAWYKSVFKSDGTLTDEFKAMVCLAVATEDTTSDPVTPPVVTPPTTPPPSSQERPPAPFLSATRGAFTNMIRLTFTVSAAAQVYAIVRSGQVVAQVQKQGVQMATFDDPVPPARAYTYEVIARSTTNGLTTKSNAALGYTQGYSINQPPL